MSQQTGSNAHAATRHYEPPAIEHRESVVALMVDNAPSDKPVN